MKQNSRTTIDNLGRLLKKRMKSQSLRALPIADKQHNRDKYNTHQIGEMMMKSSFGPGESLQDERKLQSEEELERLPTPKTVKRRLQ